MSKQTYRRFDPWRSTPIQEEARETIVGGHYFNIDRVSLTSPTVGHFERLILHKNNGDSVGVIGLTKDGRVPLIEQYRIQCTVGHWRFPQGMRSTRAKGRSTWRIASLRRKSGTRRG